MRETLLQVLVPLGFEEDDGQIQKICAPESIEDEILALDKNLMEENEGVYVV